MRTSSVSKLVIALALSLLYFVIIAIAVVSGRITGAGSPGAEASQIHTAYVFAVILAVGICAMWFWFFREMYSKRFSVILSFIIALILMIVSIKSGFLL